MIYLVELLDYSTNVSYNYTINTLSCPYNLINNEFFNL